MFKIIFLVLWALISVAEAIRDDANVAPVSLSTNISGLSCASNCNMNISATDTNISP